MKTIIAVVFAAVLALATVIMGQEPNHPPQAPHPPEPDPLAHLMFPPDMILSHASQLNLADEQKAFMRSEVQKATASFQDLQWKLQDQMQLLHDTMKSSSVNEAQALAQTLCQTRDLVGHAGRVAQTPVHHVGEGLDEGLCLGAARLLQAQAIAREV